MGNKLSFGQLSKSMDKLSEYGGMIDEINYSEVTEWISTGNYILNACLSGDVFKGIPNNRIVSFAGPSQTGKSYLMLNFVRNAQKKGYYIIFIDTENAIDKENLDKFDIDRQAFRYEPVATAEGLKVMLTQTLGILEDAKREGYDYDKVMFVLDSMGQLASEKEIKDAEEGDVKADMTRAKTLKSLFRIITLKLASLKIPFVFTNHTYKSIDMYSRDVPSGGTGAEFSPSIVMLTQRKQHPDDKKLGKEVKDKGIRKSGVVLKMVPYKNRFVRPVIVEFYLSFTRGMNPYVGLHHYVSWDACGIEYNAKIDDEGNMTKSQNGRFAVKHLGKTVSAKEVFSPEVFTPEVLKKLQDNVIAPLFNFPDSDSAEVFENDLEHSEQAIQQALDGVKASEQDPNSADQQQVDDNGSGSDGSEQPASKKKRKKGSKSSKKSDATN